MRIPLISKKASFVIALVVCALANATTTWAADFPDRPISLIVPFPPGGTTDIVARAIVEPLSKELGQPVSVHNRAGTGGAAGAFLLTMSHNDGHTIGIASNSTHIAGPLMQKMNKWATYDPIKDFTALGGIATVPNVLVVNPKKVSVKNMAELIALAKNNPERFSCASAGKGSMGHLWLGTFEVATNTNMLHTSFRGAAPALNSLVAGQTDMMFDNLPSTLPYIKDKRLQAIAVAAPKRSEALPDVPTFSELGLNDANLSGWFGLVGPAGIPEAAVKRINDALLKIMKDPAVVSALKAQGADAQGTTPQEFSNDLKSKFGNVQALVKAGKISLE